jgi:carotenoid 1,2-hydratase
VIAFVGSVFSPTYFRARRRRLDADPVAHCGFNVVVHGPRATAWAFSEYRGTDVFRGADELGLGRNRIRRDADGLHVSFDERTSPWGRPLRGRIRLQAGGWRDEQYPLDAAGRHVWWPVAPQARILVELDAPALRFEGTGYHDSNRGIEPLEQTLRGWNWSRSTDGRTTSLLYDVTPRSGDATRIGVRYGRDGIDPVDPRFETALGRSRWGLPRSTRTDQPDGARLLRTLVDTPFYARSLIASVGGAAPIRGVHEIVDLERFGRTSTQLMLPFRTRGARWF